MFLILAAILMVGIGLCNFAPRGSVSSRPVGRRRQGLRSLALAIALGLASIPTGAWAKAPGENSAQTLRTRPAATAPIATEAGAPGQDYASREASAKGLEKFEGGSTTVIWVAGGSTLLVVLIVVLIIVII